MKYPALILAAGLALVAAAPAPQATPLPTPPPLNAAAPSPGAPATPTASPNPSPTPFNDLFGGHGRHRGEKPSATPTPPAETRTGLDGVWELEIQNGPVTTYEHMKLFQTGDTITGFYLNQSKKQFPLTGVVDAQHNLRLIVARPDGSTILLEAQVDGTTDMLGMFTDAKERVPFTAEYRPKEKFFDNINAAPGGLGGASAAGGIPGGVAPGGP